MPPKQEPEAAPQTETLEQFRARRHAEWHTYIAAAPIKVGGVNAFNAGDAVPLSHVTRGVVDIADVIPATPQPSDVVDGTTSEKDA